ncbi:MAG: hypothetical protein A2599_03340 [Candidatus Staskawiczbacteria bacterium RIFOXYD1_FULL_39_28]|uniref:DUF192 domain-containing protein n=1 Tax=Candidatus Staskawiczbacteria bacterium RIFOXYC1_FULL_38_18 TaxID=1802229 RepID=A0A1G2JD79_9BACT|nr:MAG: hypothetical protein A2401_03680 [Candidatus Staskawiczbacteria bacterium RIFOXYC1_FULL_38_18]OGZ90326.1 MAG: hypothetical protein A2599_03340 [Candidatus Staskawiczbacteria bacterium RIFOXYD1_FULL_39_28]
MEFKIKAIILIVLTVFLGLAFFYSTEVLFAPSQFKILGQEVCFKSDCFLVQLAKTPAQRETGLMYKEKLDKNNGMFFVFDNESIYPFWMKNTLIPLDIIWIDKNYKVVFVFEKAQPCLPDRQAGNQVNCPLIVPSKKASYVLEINAGLSKEFDIKTGDSVQVTPGL